MNINCSITSQTGGFENECIYFTTPSTDIFDKLYFLISAHHTRAIETTYNIEINLYESLNSNAINTQNISVVAPISPNNKFEIEGFFPANKLKTNTNYILEIIGRSDVGTMKYVYLDDVNNHIICVNINDLIYISNGAEYIGYQCYIDNGSTFELYTPYIDNGTNWELL